MGRLQPDGFTIFKKGSVEILLSTQRVAKVVMRRPVRWLKFDYLPILGNRPIHVFLVLKSAGQIRMRQLEFWIDANRFLIFRDGSGHIAVGSKRIGQRIMGAWITRVQP